MGGSFKLLFIAISRNYRLVCSCIVCMDPREVKELAEIKDIKHFFCSSQNGSMIGNNIQTTST